MGASQSQAGSILVETTVKDSPQKLESIISYSDRVLLSHCLRRAHSIFFVKSPPRALRVLHHGHRTIL